MESLTGCLNDGRNHGRDDRKNYGGGDRKNDGEGVQMR
jgi:hypothetical protein